MFSPEWVSFTNIQAALSEWPDAQGITSMTFGETLRGKSANTPGFLIAVLVAEGVLETVPDKKRLHQACDPAAFLASMRSPGKGKATKAKAASTRKSPARSKKAS
jgi:hypothetical protein